MQRTVPPALLLPLATVAALSAAPVLGQTPATGAFPARQIRVVVPWTPGGAADILARVVGQKLSEAYGQQVLVDNRPGASGQIGTDLVVKSPPDGHTLLLATTAPNSTAPSLYAKLPYDPIRDFSTLSLIATTSYVMSVNPALPVASVREFVALARKRPNQLNFASPGNGTPNHLSGEMFKSLTGITMQHVPYKGSAPAIADVIGGQIPLAFENIAVVAPHIRAGKVRALAITSAARSKLLPETPTIAESGYPGFEAIGWFGLMGPPGLPKDVVARLNQDIVRVLNLPDVRERIATLGAEPMPNSPDQFLEFNRAQIAKWAKVIKDSGARAD